MEKILISVFPKDKASNTRLLRKETRESREKKLNSKMKRTKRINDQME